MVPSKSNVVCEVKEANQSTETTICSLNCPAQLEAKTSIDCGMKKILSDEDIANKLKKLVSNKQLNTGIGYKVGPRLRECRLLPPYGHGARVHAT